MAITNRQRLLNRYDGVAPAVGLSVAEAAWLAGVWDGEGYIGVSRRRRKSGRWNYSAHVTVGNTNFALIERIRALLGEHAQVHARRLPSGKTFFAVSIRRLLMGDFLRAVLPHLVGKRRQAEIVLQFRNLVDTAFRGDFPDESFEHVYLEIRALNDRRGRYP